MMTYRECYDAYLAAVDPNHTGHSLKGVARDEALLSLSCVPLLAVDNHGYSYPVYIEHKSNGDDVLWLVGAPSGWALSTLFCRFADFSNGIAIDFGQNWLYTNFRAVLDAVMQREV